MVARHVGTFGYLHLLAFGVLLPLLVIRSARGLRERGYPPRSKHFIAVIAQQVLFITVSVAVARAENLDLWAPPAGWRSAAFIAAVSLAVMVGVMAPRWRRNVEEREWKLYYFMPRSPGERSLWGGVSLFAGFGEELIYRGVMYALLWRLSGSWAAAALLVAVVFAVSHFMQGWKSMLVIFVIAVGFQAIYNLTGSLFPGMAVHFLYDLIAGLLYGYWGEKLGYPVEGVFQTKSGANPD
jgi:membrane protease YdiL (CAAX protease family)